MTDQVETAVKVSNEMPSFNKKIIAGVVVSIIAVGAFALVAKLKKKPSEEIWSEEATNAS